MCLFMLIILKIIYNLKISVKIDRTSFTVEKNERINISKYKMYIGAENMNVNIPSGF